MGIFSYFSTNTTSPSIENFEITPSDTKNFVKPIRAFYVGEEGDVSVVDPKGNTVVFVGMGVGIWPVAATRINATNTTAGSLVGIVV